MRDVSLLSTGHRYLPTDMLSRFYIRVPTKKGHLIFGLPSNIRYQVQVALHRLALCSYLHEQRPLKMFIYIVPPFCAFFKKVKICFSCLAAIAILIIMFYKARGGPPQCSFGLICEQNVYGEAIYELAGFLPSNRGRKGKLTCVGFFNDPLGSTIRRRRR